MLFLILFLLSFVLLYWLAKSHFHSLYRLQEDENITSYEGTLEITTRYAVWQCPCGHREKCAVAYRAKEGLYAVRVLQ